MRYVSLALPFIIGHENKPVWHIRSCNRLDLFVPRVRTSMAQLTPSASIGPALWNRVTTAVRSTILSGSLSSSFSYSKPVFSLVAKHTPGALLKDSFSEKHYKSTNTIQCLIVTDGIFF